MTSPHSVKTAAEQTGALRIESVHVVRNVAESADGPWELRVDKIHSDSAVLGHTSILTDAVFLNVGSTGATRVLVKAKAQGLIPPAAGRGRDPMGQRWRPHVRMDRHG